LNVVDESHVKAFAKSYFHTLQDLLARLDLEILAQIVDLLERTRLQGGTVYLIGNGGSAATASHMALDLSFCTRMRQGPRMRAISLTNSSAHITAAANDLDFEVVFTEQLDGLLQANDVLIALSASGNSENLVQAVEYANRQGVQTVGILGFDGGRLKDLCSIALHIETMKGEYGPVEDIHLIIDHLITAYFLELG
jgi:D-sedoheptulose 7-phosphate isomerase